MSTFPSQEIPSECVDQPCKAIAMIIQPKTKDLGDFSVRRVLPYAKQRMVGPWLFFDHMGPAEFAPGSGINVRPHPHINLATVTYLFAGEILHRDSLGSVQAIKPGDINLMVAGKGIVHSERESEQVKQSIHQLHGLQLWLALPEKDEETEPAFYHYPCDDIPNLTQHKVSIRVMIGKAYGVQSPVKTFADTLYVEADIPKGESLLLAQSEQRAVYVVSGEISIAGAIVKQHQMAVLNPLEKIAVQALENTRIALIGGEKMPPRYLEWNFVSSSKERIEQAKQDWRAKRFPTIPGDDKEFIPLPE